ncbi:extracellular solute-binding protein [Bosea sp. (in: a-proteobacteria)]|uniref:extracellular solute-binding protein n=1 Tax=Bosea sp. (in: a-proteobacteria) TaxID=1871050 RepID=UPI002612D0E2|nr:extracellular solute-binding protein [Bosea sp. (in: a-proteobacteria)]MCO5089715.1 extracellular solute-binding protein [Bosea sp. (in: a-proteobacteria)]
MVIRNLAAAALLSLTLGTTAWAQEKKVTLYSSNPEQAIEAVASSLKKKAPEIRLNSVTGGSGVLLRRLEAEASNVQGDLFWSSSFNTVGAFEKLFEAYASPELAAIPEKLRYPGNLFTPANVHVVVIMVNTNQLGNLPAPKTWTELLDPKWKGKVVIADPANSSTGYTILWGLHKMIGDEKLRQLTANLTVSSSSSAVQSGVAMGEYAVGLGFEANGYPYVDGGQKEFNLIYPEDGTFITADFAGLVKGAPGGAAAKAAFDGLMSKETQTSLLETSFRRPSRSDIEVSKIVKLPEMSAIKVFDIDEKEAADQRDAFLKTWRSYPTAGAK